MKGVLVAMAILFTGACAELPAVVTDIANIANIVLGDIAKGETGDPIVADVLTQTGTTDINLVISIVESLLSDSKTPAAEVPALQSVLTAAKVRLAAKRGASAIVE